jgi:carboxyl-terminal processing protease
LSNNGKKLGCWLIIAGLAIGSFSMGSRLRSWQESPDVIAAENTHVNSIQASALLKLTPECAPITPQNDMLRSPVKYRQLVSNVLALLKTQYVEPITSQKETEMARGAVCGMINSLADTDSRFLDPKERKQLDDAASGRLHGIGAVLAMKKEKADGNEITKLIIVTQMPGSPAEKAGLKPGDSVTHLNGKWIITYDPFREASFIKMEKGVRNKEISEYDYQKAFEAAAKKIKEGMPLSEAVSILTSKTSGEITVNVDRPGASAPVKAKIACKETQVVPVVEKTIDKNTAYIKITQFNAGAAKAFDAGIKKARNKGAKAIIIDLRNNPGGLLQTASYVTGNIAGGGKLGIICGNNRKRIIETPKKEGLKMPVAVLVNGGTASVAELAAGTLRDRIGATIIGTKTFGDGLTQTPLLLKDGSMALLTTGKMLTSGGYDFEGKGIVPDIEISQQSGAGDAQLAAAIKILKKKLGRA